MTNFFKTLTLVFITSFGFSQVFDVDTLLYSGPSDERINIVILGDGYQLSEMDQFILDANDIKDAFVNETPYKEYQSHFNILAIKVPSNDSGADHPGTASDVSEPAHPVQDVDTYFGSTFDYAGIHRLIVATNSSAITSVLATNFPLYDLVIVLANSSYYGGSGGWYATLTTDNSSKEVGLHEIGHSFVGLADEYYAGDNYSTEKINMTQETDPNLVKWKNWYGDNGIGIYQHSGGGNSAQWYKPHQTCKMNYLGYPFCSVCIEATIERIHDLTSSIKSYSPSFTSLSNPNYPLEFSVDLLKPEPNTLKTSWTLNNVNVFNNLDTVSFTSNDFSEGNNQVQVVVVDTTELLRIDDHLNVHFKTILWTIEKSSASISQIVENSFSMSIFPNPTADNVSVAITSDKNLRYKVHLLDVKGKVLQTQPYSSDLTHEFDLKSYQTGVYYLQFQFEDGTTISKEVLKN